MSKPSELLSQPGHLVRRFWFEFRAHPPTSVDDQWARSYLLPREQVLWDQMQARDQTHSIIVARRFLQVRPGATRPEMAGALLHDVGKVLSRLSTFERVLASVIGGRTKRFRSYLDHEALGAELAANSGSSPVTVDLIAARGPAYETLQACDHI